MHILDVEDNQDKDNEITNINNHEITRRTSPSKSVYRCMSSLTSIWWSRIGMVHEHVSLTELTKHPSVAICWYYVPDCSVFRVTKICLQGRLIIF